MNRRRSMNGVPYSPTETAALAPELREHLTEAMITLPPGEAGVLRLRFGFAGRPLSYEEIGHFYGADPERFRKIASRALRRLRHSQRFEFLVALGTDTPPLLSQSVREESLNFVGRVAPTWCDDHGWSVPDDQCSSSICASCPCVISMPKTGRHRKYCSDTCRQRAHRRRVRKLEEQEPM